MTGWGVPDWHEASAYSGDLTDRQWWWEFTRRRPDYRNLWHSQSSGLVSDYRNLRLEFEMSTLLDPRETHSDWRLMHHRYPRNAGSQRGPRDGDEILAKLEEEAGTYWYSFNLKQPLKAQLQKAEMLLKAIQTEERGNQKRKPEKANWHSYLRILDARDDGASWRTIGLTLWPDAEGSSERARSHYEGAVQIRDRFPTETL